MNLNLSILERAYFGNSVLQWITSVLLILLFILLGRVCFWAIERRIKTVSSKTQSSFIELFVHSIKAPIIIIVIGFGIRLGLATLDFPNQFEIWIEHGFNLLVTIVLAWALINIYDQIHVHFLLPFARKTDANIDEQLLAIVRNVIRFSIWMLAIVIGLSNAGYDVGAIIAGLGIGGLAFALAGQNIISNFFGGILCHRNRSTRFYLGSEKWDYTTCRTKNVTKTHCNKFSDGTLIHPLTVHFCYTLTRSKNVGRIDRFIC